MSEGNGGVERELLYGERRERERLEVTYMEEGEGKGGKTEQGR